MITKKTPNLLLVGLILIMICVFSWPYSVGVAASAKPKKPVKALTAEERLQKGITRMEKKMTAMEKGVKEAVKKKTKMATRVENMKKRLAMLKKKKMQSAQKKAMKKPASTMPVAASPIPSQTMPATSYSAVLADVRGGSAAGLVQVFYGGWTYSLSGVFSSLPELKGTEFYEGWIVGDLGILSTGKAQKSGSVYTNMFMSNQDLTKNMKYILTLEPDESDPAPSVTHVLEGNLIKP